MKFPTPKPTLLLIKSPQKKFLKNLSSSSTINSENSIHSNNSNNSTDGNDAAENGNDTAENESNSSIINNISGSLFTKNGNSSSSNLNHSTIRLVVNTPSIAYLPNDLVPVHVHLQHIKNVKSLNGIIITLIRICKIDNSPDGGVQSFRKDLSQVIKPLYLDPQSLELEVNTNIKIPYDIFPTIRGAPLVSFEYYVEVVANLSNRNTSPAFDGSEGKTNGASKQSRGSDDTASGSGNGRSGGKKFRSKNGDSFTGSQNDPVNYDNQIINVDKLKRLKNVISVSRRIVIGTERVGVPNSNLTNNSSPYATRHLDVVGYPLSKSRNNSFRSNNSGAVVVNGSASTSSSPINNDSQNANTNTTPPQVNRSGSYSNDHPESNGNIDNILNQSNGHASAANGSSYLPPSPPPPPPPPMMEDSIIDNQHLSEKERLRRHEESLLPSEPPTMSSPSEPPAGYFQSGGVSFDVDIGVPANVNEHATIPFVPVLEEDEDEDQFDQAPDFASPSYDSQFANGMNNNKNYNNNSINAGHLTYNNYNHFENNNLNSVNRHTGHLSEPTASGSDAALRSGTTTDTATEMLNGLSMNKRHTNLETSKVSNESAAATAITPSVPSIDELYNAEPLNRDRVPYHSQQPLLLRQQDSFNSNHNNSSQAHCGKDADNANSNVSNTTLNIVEIETESPTNISTSEVNNNITVSSSRSRATANSNYQNGHIDNHNHNSKLVIPSSSELQQTSLNIASSGSSNSNLSSNGITTANEANSSSNDRQSYDNGAEDFLSGEQNITELLEKEVTDYVPMYEPSAAFESFGNNSINSDSPTVNGFVNSNSNGYADYNTDGLRSVNKGPESSSTTITNADLKLTKQEKKSIN